MRLYNLKGFDFSKAMQLANIIIISLLYITYMQITTKVLRALIISSLGYLQYLCMYHLPTHELTDLTYCKMNSSIVVL